VLKIDGSQGEGGGQILRSALALSLVTGTPFRIEKIRAGRAKPGLLRQHLAAVKAAEAVGQAQVDGAELGATELVVRPGVVRGGEYHFAVGSAGSACLVLQTVLTPLLLAPGPSVLVLEGGTHNPAAPPWDYVAGVFLPMIERMGPRVTTRLEHPGFFPAGGGRFRVEIAPVTRLSPISVLERGEIRRRRASALVAHLPRVVGERELAVVCQKLSGFEAASEVREIKDTPGPGNVLLVELECDHVAEMFVGFGERGLRAEEVADRVVHEVRQYLLAGVPVGPHLADQLVLPLALAGAGTFRTTPVTRHMETNIEVVQKFLPVRVRCTAEQGGAVRFDLARS